jgi:outer membrane immunogenic protein
MAKRMIVLLALALPAWGPSAFAADLPAKMPVKAPVVAPFTWAGPYAGVNFGYSWGDWDTAITIPGGSYALSPNVDGWLAGLQIGRNWQNGNWVFGLEADIQITGEDDRDSPGTGGSTAITSSTVEWDFPWFATLRARLGHVYGDQGRHLLYVTGGAAVGKVEFDYLSAPPTIAISGDRTRWGWTIGGGWEYAYNHNWSFKLEYLYLDLGTASFTGTPGASASIDVKDHVVRAGFNYRWGDAPVKVKY